MSLRRARVWCWLGACLLARTLVAADDGRVIHPGGTRTATAPTGGGYETPILFLALALAGAGGWLFWRGRQRAAGGLAAHSLHIAETRSMGNRQYLVVARFENKRFLLGICPERIQLLAQLPDETHSP
ncbi:MAG: flagellar biosynthetic protein FliO [Verrucomicrobia bacterium]|nr:flagellar biosynthetic protein FliO [Verrucomicrobiota bacterium]